MNDIEKTFQHLLAGLDDKELQHLSSAMYREVETRIQAKVLQGYYPAPAPEELTTYHNGMKLKAIQDYRERSKVDASIREIKSVFDSQYCRS